jgi:glycosyltransferase involved in cell wall biosynthesis
VTVVWHVDLRPGRLRVDGIRAAIDALEGELRAEDIEVRRVATRADARALARLMRRKGPDAGLLHLHSVFRPGHDALALVARRTGHSYVISPHSALSQEGLDRQAVRKAAWLTVSGRRLLRRAAAVCCLSPQEAADVAAAAPGSRTAVVRNAIPHEVLSERSWDASAATPGLAVSLARWDVRQKGLDILADIAQAAPSLEFRVHGEQDKNEPRATARLLQTAPANFGLEPPVFGPDKLDLLRSASIYVMSSRWEGLSMSLLEALALGVPVAVSRFVARTVPVAEEGLGLVLDDEPAAAAAQLAAAVEDRAQLERWSAAGRAWVTEACAPAAVARDLADVYRRAARRRDDLSVGRSR